MDKRTFRVAFDGDGVDELFAGGQLAVHLERMSDDHAVLMVDDEAWSAVVDIFTRRGKLLVMLREVSERS